MMRSPVHPADPHEHETRRLRDLLRSNVVRGVYPGGQLPSETDLMHTHQATRRTVRDALAMLRAEGLVERTQGVGTFSVSQARLAQLIEVHGRPVSSAQQVFVEEMRPRILDRSVVATPATVATRLGADCGDECLRLEYVQLCRDEPIAVATNYVRFPEAEQLGAVPFRSDWYSLLDDADLLVGESELLLGCSIVDGPTATLLDIPVGSPVMTMEQVIWGPDGAPFDWAFIVIRSDRFLFFSRAGSEQAVPRPNPQSPFPTFGPGAAR